LFYFAREAAGALATRLSLRPLFSRAEILAQPGRIAPREGGGMFAIGAPSLRARRSNPFFLCAAAMDCFVASAPRNDGDVGNGLLRGSLSSGAHLRDPLAPMTDSPRLFEI